MEKLLHPVDDARILISIGRNKFYEEVAAGRLVIIKVGKKSLVPQSSIDEYILAKINEAKDAKQRFGTGKNPVVAKAGADVARTGIKVPIADLEIIHKEGAAP